MKLSERPKVTAPRQKRRGLGYGSGKGGHTTGRGAKGCKARTKVRLTATGTKIKKSIFQRLPVRRGKSKLKPLSPKPLEVNLDVLNLLPKGTLVDVASLAKYGLVQAKDAEKWGVKILGGGKLERSLKVALPISRGAAEKVKQAGGEVVVIPQASEKKAAPQKSSQKTSKQQDKKGK